MSSVTRVAMWSGPRNISTAMMRAWENRGDTAVWDEPLYAFYLDRTGIDHPGAVAVIAAGDTQWQRVVAALTGPVPEGKPIYFQKHMTHHLLEEIDWDWLAQVHNCFLIRDPREVIASYARTRPDFTVNDVGVLQQAKIFEHAHRTAGATPVVLDSRDVLQNPRAMLTALCAALDVPFSDKMLSWPAGSRSSDGVWASYWYDTVRASTEFAPYVSKTHTLARAHEPLAEECEPHYRQLYEQRLRP
ncbi:MAG: HAD family hydrolase [Gammaproteobacteria bacterium]|nr:HAD family hydrolase [Gammaproteobacteria bacterium]MDX2462012.1 HAD family hydrolase [Gammaproteobacteria bacterium]